MTDPIKACRVKVLDKRGRPKFELCFYGLHAAELNLVVDYGKKGPPDYPTYGAAVIRHAMRRRGLNPDDYVCTPFHIEDMRRDYGRTVPREYHRS